MNVNYALDNSAVIKDILQSLQDAVLLAIILVMVLVVAALGLRSGMLVGISIPTSFLIGFLIIWLMGYTVNIMIMFGLLLSVGILVDGAIVLVEYADRKMAEGLRAEGGLHRRLEAHVLADRLLDGVTIVAFLPLLFSPGIAGDFMSYLPITVITVLGAALFTAMVFVPARRLLHRQDRQGDAGAVRPFRRRRARRLPQDERPHGPLSALHRAGDPPSRRRSSSRWCC